MKYNYPAKNAESEFDSPNVDENAKGVRIENYRNYSPISSNMQAGGESPATADLSLLEHQFTFKPVAKSRCVFFKGIQRGGGWGGGTCVLPL